jgi:hypothetical protein
VEPAERTSRAVWPLTWLSTAIGIAAAAFLAARGTEAVRNACHLAAYADRLDSTGLGIRYRPPSCSAADVQFSVWIYIAIVSTVIALIALGILLRRGSKAAAAGQPWPTRRVSLAIAAAVNRRLSGAQVGPRAVTALSFVLLVVVLAGGALAFRSYRSSADKTNFQRTARALAAVRKLPAGLTPVRGGHCGGALCARSALAPAKAAAVLAAFLKTTVEPGLDGAHCARSSSCTLYVGGRFDGFPTLAGAVLTPGRHPAVAEIYLNPTLPSRYG